MIDSSKSTPDNYKVMFENQRVRVLDVRYGPGVKSEMHSHPDLVVVALTPASVKFTLAGGQVADIGQSRRDLKFRVAPTKEDVAVGLSYAIDL